MRKASFLASVCTLCTIWQILSVTTLHAETTVTLKTHTRRSVGGVGTLDRAQYFNHWGQLTPGRNTNLGDLETAVHSPTDLHTFSGRETNDFVAAMQSSWRNGLPEDPNNPGFFDRTALVNHLQNTGTNGYKHRILQGSLFDSVRDSENPIYVTSGRKDSPDSGSFTNIYPDFLTGGSQFITNNAGFADFLNVYLEEVVYGTGPGQGYLADVMDPERFYIEIMNEPNWPAQSHAQWQTVINTHRQVTELVKEVHPQAKLGGPSCCDGLDGHPSNNWDRVKQLMDDMTSWQTPSGESVELDFWTIHPYEFYRVLSDGSFEQQSFSSPGHTSAIMDLYESYSNIKFGDPKAFAITEYGSWNQTDITNGPGSADDDYGSYSRAEQQWDLVRDTREKLMVFMERPDRIINATPFLGPIWWERQTPSSPAGDNVFWERDAQGNWHETIVASMYRMHNDIRGEYLDVDSDNADLQVHAFRDGNKVYVMLNNLENIDNTIDLQTLAGSSSVVAASMDRIFWNGSQGVYESDVDVSSTWQNLTLVPDEGAVLTLTLAGPELYDLVTDERTYYGDDTITPLNLPSGRSKNINIAASTENAVTASVRVAYHRGSAPLGEGFQIVVNGNIINVPAGELEFDDNDQDMISRQVDVPVAWLVDGNNTVSADFVGNGGELITAVLLVTHSIGDYNDSQAFDGEDLSMLVAQFGTATADSEYDLNTDGVIDSADLDYWLQELRGTTIGLGDFDLDDDLDADDLALLRANYGTGTHYGHGDLDFDGDVDGKDFLAWQVVASAAGVSLEALGTAIPEPTTVCLLGIALLWQGGLRRKEI